MTKVSNTLYHMVVNVSHSTNAFKFLTYGWWFFFSYGTLRNQNASCTTDINPEGFTVAVPIHTKKKHHPGEPGWLSFHTYISTRM